MSGFSFQEPEWLWLLLIVIPGSFLLLLYQQKNSIKDLRMYRDQPINKAFRWRYSLFHFGALIALVSALARPGWNPESEGVNESGRDTIFLLDVSRSMLARDVRPDRLSAAKNAMRRLINRNAGDRFGLVIFAGTPLISSPLTNDRFFLNNVLDNLNTDSVSQGGTLINDALMEVLDKMIDEENGASTDIVLISDGEDLGGDTAQALAVLNLLGTRLLVVGLGDSQYGARVPARKGEGWTQHDGKEHWSKRDDKTLRALAQGVDQGVYFPVGTDYLDLKAIMIKLQAMWPGTQRNDSKVLKYTEGYPWLLGMAALLQLMLILRIRQRVLAAGLMVLSFNAYSDGGSDYDVQDVAMLEAKAIIHTKTQEYEKAAVTYRQIWQQADNQAVAVSASFNLATSLMLQAMQKSSEKKSNADARQRLARKKQQYLTEARQLYRDILVAHPEHQGSARNLELLTMIADQQQSQKGRSGKNGQQNQEQQEGNGSSNDSQGQGDSSNPSSNSSSGPSFNDLILPTPLESAKDIMDESRKGNKSRAGWRKQSPVERDW
ncbi:hypothetical protein ACH42_04575 [Endozoicomonas sp. (ex Bugula neritina AB1)]|nr:hypothetical protein ACH42_04575 [Endozoicomonas sp. (ex Bugula neritina AB1)]